jgi:hypothetical protein
MVPVLLIIYGVPLYSIGVFKLKIQIAVQRDDHDRIFSIYYMEANNVKFLGMPNIHTNVFIKGTTLNVYIGITTICSALFLAFCILINVAILWAYRQRRKLLKSQQSTAIGGTGTSVKQQRNAVAKTKADRIERRLLIFALISFFGHVLMTIMLVSNI